MVVGELQCVTNLRHNGQRFARRAQHLRTAATMLAAEGSDATPVEMLLAAFGAACGGDQVVENYFRAVAAKDTQTVSSFAIVLFDTVSVPSS